MSCFRTFSVVLILYLVAVQMVSGSSSHFSHCSRLIMILVMVSIHSWKMSCCLTHCFGKVNQAAAWMLSVCLCLQYCCENLSIWDYCCFFLQCYFFIFDYYRIEAFTDCCCFRVVNTHTHTHPFNSPLSGTTQVSRYQKGKTNLDFTGARDSEW